MKKKIRRAWTIWMTVFIGIAMIATTILAVSTENDAIIVVGWIATIILIVLLIVVSSLMVKCCFPEQYERAKKKDEWS